MRNLFITPGLKAKRSGRWSTCAVLLLVVGSSCGGGDSSSETTTTAPETPAPSVSEPSTTEAVIDYQQEYRRAVAASNCKNNALYALEVEIFGTTDDLTLQDATQRWEENRDRIRQAYLDLAVAARDMADRLGAITWPVEIRAEIEESIAFQLADAEAVEKAANAENYLAYYNAVFPPRPESAARIRAALDLPSADDDTTDFCALAET